MGTRGVYGFYYKGKYFVFYNKYDSYPSGLGLTLLGQLKRAIEEGCLDTWRSKLESIIIVPSDYSEWLENKPDDSLSTYYDNGIDNTPNLFIEYTYLVDLDANKFVVRSIDWTSVLSYDFDNLPNTLPEEVDDDV